jgi:hypothetical protein
VKLLWVVFYQAFLLQAVSCVYLTSVEGSWRVEVVPCKASRPENACHFHYPSIDYENGQGSGDILWRLGYQGDFTMTTGQPSDWFYGQHYPTFVSPNSTGVFNFEVFDDGNDRVLDAQGDVCGTAGQPACYSTVPIYQVDEAGMTATPLWQDNLAPVFCLFRGSAQQLADTNVVFGITTPSDDPTGARYMEVTHDPSPQIVSQMEVSGQNAYRAVHLPSLYPGVQW